MGSSTVSAEIVGERVWSSFSVLSHGGDGFVRLCSAFNGLLDNPCPVWGSVTNDEEVLAVVVEPFERQ